jgi:hypothetical protein
MFRHTRDGGVRAWVSAGEAALLRTLVAPMIDLMGGDRMDKPARSVVDELEELFSEGPDPQTPTDPVLARLLPDAYRDAPDMASEYRR